jgi:DNA-binding NarL/FixJ family response regulator
MMLADVEDVLIVAEAEDGTQVVPAVNEHAPDIVLMDIRMPRMDGLTATELLRSRRERPEIIILTTFDTDDHVLRAMRAGASGFLLKHTPPAEIMRAIRLVAAGEPMLSPSVLRRVMSHVATADTDPRRTRAKELLGRAHRSGKDQRRDQPGAAGEHRDGEGVRVAAAHQVGAEQPGAGGTAVHDSGPADPAP